VTGREAIVRAYETLFAAFPDLTAVFEPPIIEDNRLAVVTETSGTHSATLMGLAPTGRKFRFRIVFLLDVADGQIARDRRIYDFTGLLLQVGVLKAKPA